MKMLKTLGGAGREQWRAWLVAHHQTEKEVWLIFARRHTGKPSIPYEDAVEEALCFGWIDSVIQRLDTDHYARKFTPRADRANWSELNRKRLARLIAAGRMTAAGLAKAGCVEDGARRSVPLPGARNPAMPRFMAQALRADEPVWANFKALAPSERRRYVLWITTAKKRETRERRLREAIQRLARGEKLGLK